MASPGPVAGEFTGNSLPADIPDFVPALADFGDIPALIIGSTLVTYADLARELAMQGSRVIVTSGTTAVNAAHLAAPDLPIVMAGSADPELMGFARSLARPGGRITGISIRGEEILGKQPERAPQVLLAVRLNLRRWWCLRRGGTTG